MLSMDIFKGSAFSVIALTDVINRIPFVPSFLGKAGIFTSDYTNLTSLTLEDQGGILMLVKPTPRGGPGVTTPPNGRNIRSVAIPHFQIDDSVMADEVQGIRAFGTESELETVQGKVASKLAWHTQSLELTQELARMGAVKGIVTYADGTTLDLFALFGLSQPAQIAFDLTNKVDGNLRQLCQSIIRAMGNALGGIPFTGITVLCGDNFFDDLIKNKEVRETYLNTQSAADLRTAYIDQSGSTWGQFSFGGLTFINYRGGINIAGGPAVPTDECVIFPTGVPGLFKEVYGPADYVEAVNTMGKKRYAKQWLMDNDKGINMEAQTNVVTYCTRPGVLMRGKRGA